MHCAYLPPEERSTASLSGSAAAAAGGAAGGDDALAAASMVKKEKCLFFHLLQEDHKTALPAERLLRTLTVFPALTLMNATLTELDVCMLPSAAASGSSVPLKRPPPASALQRLQQLQQQPVFQGILTRQSVFYVYEVPPSRQLSLWLRFAVLEDARWSPPLRNFLSSEVCCCWLCCCPLPLLGRHVNTVAEYLASIWHQCLRFSVTSDCSLCLLRACCIMCLNFF